MLDGNCTFNVLVYADADSEVPLEWGDSDAKEIQNGEKVQLRSFSTSNHRVDTLVSYRYVAIAESNQSSADTWIQAGGLVVFQFQYTWCQDAGFYGRLESTFGVNDRVAISRAHRIIFYPSQLQNG
jgi:hypothetical protein